MVRVGNMIALCVAFGASVAAYGSANEMGEIPNKIICIPHEYKRLGLVDFEGFKPEMHLFEYGGKVKITKDGNRNNYSYGSEGEDYFIVKEKSSISSGLRDLRHEVLLVVNSDGHGKDGKYILQGAMGEQFFHIDLKQGRYYGYFHESGAVNSYSGTCSVMGG